jgi:hypothetical protein
MRKLILATAMLSAWAIPAYAQFTPLPIPIRSPIPIPRRCCQSGVTYGATAFRDLPSCDEVLIFEACPKGTTEVAGTCQTDGACSGATVCCEGVAIGESCTAGFHLPGGPTPYNAEPDSCAKATEAECDAKSAAGEVATRSVPGGTCSKPSSTCSVPPPPIQ